MRVPAHRSPGSARHRVATLAANQVADHWADIARHISSRPLPSVTQARIAASRLEPPWRASRRRPGEMDRIGLIDPDLARDLARTAARNPRSTWCVTVTDSQGHAIGHGCARPVKRRKPDGPDPPSGPSLTFTPADHPGPPGGYGTWRFTTGQQDMMIKIGPIPTGDCDHRWQARGHDPGVMLRHLAEVRHATCTEPGCRRPGRPRRLRTQHSPTKPAAAHVCAPAAQVPPRPPPQATPPLERRTARQRCRPLDCTLRTPVHHRADPVPHLSCVLRSSTTSATPN